MLTVSGCLIYASAGRERVIRTVLSGLTLTPPPPAPPQTTEEMLSEMTGPGFWESWLHWRSATPENRRRAAVRAELEKTLHADHVRGPERLNTALTPLLRRTPSRHVYTRLQTVWSLPGHSRQANKGHSPRCHRRPNGPGRLADKVVQPTTQSAEWCTFIVMLYR